MEKIKNYRSILIRNAAGLRQVEKENRENTKNFIPYANSTPFVEIAENVIKDREGDWKSPMFYIISYHRPTHGINFVMEKAFSFFKSYAPEIDILSIEATMEKDKIKLQSLVRIYKSQTPIKYEDFFALLNDPVEEVVKVEEDVSTGNLIVPDEIKNFSYSESEIKLHKAILEDQNKIYESCSEEKPFLNSIDKFEPSKLPTPADTKELVYDLLTNDKKYKTIATYEAFTKVFEEIMTFVNGVEYYNYITVIQGEKSESEFMDYLEDYIRRQYVAMNRLDTEDVPVLLKKLYRALFQFYVVQDLIDDPNVTDIKITGPDSIRARVKGKAYLSNIHFIDANDYRRFVNTICIKNRISQSVPSQTFTDTSDPNYIIRFSITAEYVNSVDYPYLHIRKIDRNKLMADDLIAAGMMDEKIRDYLLDCGKNSRGVVFAGPPGSGKTVCLNWFLEEAYEQSAEILVIQENDELFCYRKGVMFQHVVKYGTGNEQPVSLEELGQLALVAGANVFIIGEAKGAEICSAITLSNSGCRTAITIHSPSSTETIDKMADLAMRGYASDVDQAKRMIRSFQTIVYLEGFKIKEISEIVGYDDVKKDMIYKHIYKREEEN